MNTPKVSIIVPVYGVEKYIERCARSLFKQTLDDIEYIFVDDCSPDRSIEVLQNLLTEYPYRQQQARVVRMEKNSGQAAVRMRGIMEAKGEYIMFCDSDDWVEINYCEAFYNEAVVSCSDMVICDYYIAKDEKCRTLKSEYFSVSETKEEILRKILHGILSSSLWNKIYKKSLFVENRIMPPKGDMGEDLVILIQVLYYCNKVSYLQKSLYYYFFNDNSITNDVGIEKAYSRFKSSSANTKVIDNFIKEKGLEDELDDEFTYLKLRKINYLLPLLSSKEMFTQWKYTYPDLFSKVIKSNVIPVKEKISYYLTYLGLRFVLK